MIANQNANCRPSANGTGPAPSLSAYRSANTNDFLRAQNR